jgi:hypothetical protein
MTIDDTSSVERIPSPNPPPRRAGQKMNATLITVAKRDGSTKTVRSPYNDGNIIARLRELSFPTDGKPAVIRSSFASDLCVKDAKYGLSPKQKAWAHILVVEAEAPKAVAPATVTLSAIRAMLDSATSQGLKTPKVLTNTPDGNKVRMSRAGDSSKNPGRIHVTDGLPFGENTYYGYIDADGDFFSRSSVTPAIVAALKEFNDDPTATAAAYGQRTGNCCFCARTLSTVESTSVGYGPVCAERYALPWGA